MFFSFTDTATIYLTKSFGKQSVTSWFAGMRFFHFWSMFESAVSPLGTRVGVQRELPRRGGGEGDGLVAGWRFSGRMEDGLEVIARVLPIELQHLHTPPPFPPSSLYTHTHTHTLSLSHTHTPTFRAARCYYFAVSC